MAELVFAQTAQDLDGRTGYDPSFLGVDVPVPELTTGHPTAVFLYLHYSVLFRPDRRFAAVTALAPGGGPLFSVERSGSWGLDPPIADELQAGAPGYADHDPGPGHPLMR